MMIWMRLPNRGKSKNLWINHLILTKCSNKKIGNISLNGQFCELSCASFKLSQYLLAKVSARDDMQELAGIMSTLMLISIFESESKIEPNTFIKVILS
jgi:hypothetical protein